MSGGEREAKKAETNPVFLQREIRSALIVSLMRAVHSRFDADPLIDDPHGLVILTEEDRASLRDFLSVRRNTQFPASTAGALDDAVLAAVLRAWPGYGNVVVRTRVTEDLLLAAVKSGIAQYVLVGSGFDSFSLRKAASLPDLRVFEIDHPATQEVKKQRFAAAGLVPPHTVTLLSADLERTSVTAALSTSDFRLDRPAFFSWLGVSPYLTQDASEQVLRSIARCAAPGSALVLTYLAPLENDEGAIYARLHPQAVADVLDGCGFQVIKDFDAFMLAGRYCAGRDDGLGVTTDFHIVHARVGQRQGTAPT